MVAYNRDIPDAPNNPSNDQPKMKVNTNAVDDIFKVDHVSFNTANGGTHLQSTYNPIAVKPPLVSNEVAVYAKTVSATTQLFYEDMLANEVQLSVTSIPVSAATGRSWLPGNMLIQWGTFNNTTGNTAITFSPAFSANPYFCGATSTVNSSSVRSFVHVALQSTTGANVQLVADGSGGFDTSAQTVQWVAIGPA